MITQALESNGAVIYIIGRRKEVLDKAASTAVRREAGSQPYRRSVESDSNWRRNMGIFTRFEAMSPAKQIWNVLWLRSPQPMVTSTP